jgi:ABC-type glycerol-3-phosphate transport system substrate-binding protein
MKERKMKKLIILLLAAILVFLPLGCAQKPPAQDVTLKFVRIGNDAAEAEYWKSLITRFEAATPGIKIQYDDAAVGEPMETKLNSMFSAGMGPDIIGHGIMSVAARAVAKNYQPVTKYFNTWEGKDDIMPSVLANGTFNKEVYGLAYSTTPYVFAYRKDLFSAAGLDPEKPPMTWDELKQYAEKLTVKEGDRIITSGFSFPKSAGNFVEFDCFVFGNGGRYYDADGKPTLDTPEKAEAFTFLSSFIGNVSIPFSNTEINPFINGNAAMTLINNVALTGMLKNEAYKDKIGIALPPSNTGKKQETFSGCNMLFIGGDCKNPDAAFKFISFALTKEEVMKRATDLNIPVTRNSQVKAFTALNPMNAIRASCVANGIGMPRTTWAAAFQKVRNTMVQEVLYSKASPEEALKKAQQALLDEIK